MRLGCWGLIIALGMIFYGGQGVYQTWTTGGMTTETLERFEANKPESGWYELTDAQWKLADGLLVSEEKTGKKTGSFFVPVTRVDAAQDAARADGKKPGAKARKSSGADAGEPDAEPKIDVVITHYDEDLATRLEKLIGVKTSEETLKLLDSDPEYDKARRVSGLVKGIFDSAADKDIKAALGDKLADKFVLISQGEKPDSYGSNLALLAAGLALLGFTAWGLGRKNGTPNLVDD